MPGLTSALVEELMTFCLMSKEEHEANEQAMRADGITGTFMFHEGRIFERGGEIDALLHELPEPFQEKSGGGWSFLNGCEDKHGIQWTGEHRMVEALMCLGIARGKVEYLMPREMWAMLPGGMPYFVVK